MIHILGTGLSGLVGSRIRKLLGDTIEWQNLSRETGFDITDYSSMKSVFQTSPSTWVFHFAAFTNVAEAEEQKTLGHDSDVWKINVDATEYICSLCQKYHKNLIYLSTDYVFDGKADEYPETAIPHPIGWYGMTKWEGEKHVQSLGNHGCIIRISNPYCAFPQGKLDFVHKMKERFEQSLPVEASLEQRFSPTLIDDIVTGLLFCMKNDISGVMHIASPHALSPLDAATQIASLFGYDASLVHEISFTALQRTRPWTPQRVHLVCGKMNNESIPLHTFDTGLEAVYKEEEKHI